MAVNNNEQNKYKYDAFISYRHGGVDEVVAKELHKMLEGYRLPAGVKSPTGKKVIKKIFKDTEELPLASNLSDPIVEAIKESEHLIVVCSPRLRESEWCKTELKTFMDYHGRENIYCVIAEGEPSEVFPFPLTMREDGTPIEPLAADFRGEDNKVIKAKMKSEILRLIAPMFKLGYDDIKRREREQKIKVLVRSSIMITAAAVFLGGYFAFTSYRLSAQNKKIEEQSLEISEQANEIIEQNNQLKIDRARDLSAESLRYLEEDRIGDAINSAYQSAVYNEDALPYTAGTQYALSQCLRLYENGYDYVATNQISMPALASATIVSPDGKYVILGDEAGDFKVYDLVSRNIVYTGYCRVGYSKTADGMNTIKQFAGFLDEKTMYYVDIEGEFVAWDIEKKTEVATISIDYVNNVTHNADNSIIVISTLDEMIVYETRDMSKPLCNISTRDTSYELCVSEDKEYLIYGDEIDLYSDDETTMLHVVELETGEEVSSIVLDAGSIEAIIEDDGYVYVAVCEDFKDFLNYGTNIMKIDYINSKVEWDVCCEGAYYYLLAENIDGYIFAYGNMTGTAIRCEDGSKGNMTVIGERIASNIRVIDGKWCGLTENGLMMLYNPHDNDCMGYDLVDCVPLVDVVMANGVVVGAPKESNRIIIYSTVFNPDAKPYDGEVDYIYNEDYGVNYSYEYDSIETKYDVPNPAFVESYVEVEDENILLVCYGDCSVKFFDLDNMEELSTINLDGVMSYYYGEDVLGNKYISSSLGTYCVNESMEIIGYIKSFAGLTPDRKEIIIRNDAPGVEVEYYTIPIYEYEELVQMAADKIG